MADRRISYYVDAHGVNQVAAKLTKLNTVGTLVKTTFTRLGGVMAGFAKSLWRHKVMIAAAAAGIGYAIFKPFVGLEESLARVQVALGDFAGESIGILSDLADQLGRDTLYSASQAAEGMLYLAKSGMDVNQILAATPGVLNAAIVEGLDLATAADVVTDALVTMGLAADQSGRVADVLAKASNLAKTNIPEMGAAVGKVGTIARLTGHDFEQLVAMLDVLAGYGIRGEEAGTHLRMAMLTFESMGAGAITAAAKKSFASLGINVDQISKKIKAGELTFVNFAKMLYETGAEAAEFGTIFEKRTAAAVIALGEAASGTNPKIEELYTELLNAAGYAKKAGDILEDTLSGQLKQIGSSFQTLTNTIARTFAPALQDWLENTLRPWINDVTRVWEDAGDTWQEKFSAIWTEKLKPTFLDMITGMRDLLQNNMGKITSAMATLAQELVSALVTGVTAALGPAGIAGAVVGLKVGGPFGAIIGGGIGLVANKYLGEAADWVEKNASNKWDESGSGMSMMDMTAGDWDKMFEEYERMARPTQFVTPTPGLNMPESMSLPIDKNHPLLPQETETALRFPPALDQWLENVHKLIDLAEEVSANTDAIEENTVAEMTFSEKAGEWVTKQFEAVSKMLSSMGAEKAAGWVSNAGGWLGGMVTQGLGGLLGGIEGALISAITAPILESLNEFIGPTLQRIKEVMDAVLHIFDPVIKLMNMILDVIIAILGGPNYNEGRYTAPGSYQYAYANGGIAATPQVATLGEKGPEMVLPLDKMGEMGSNPMTVNSTVQIEHMEISGVRDAEDAGARAVEEISRYEEATTRQMARSLQQGMLKREAMER